MMALSVAAVRGFVRARFQHLGARADACITVASVLAASIGTYAAAPWIVSIVTISIVAFIMLASFVASLVAFIVAHVVAASIMGATKCQQLRLDTLAEYERCPDGGGGADQMC